STLQPKSVSLNETQLHSYFKDSKSANIEEVSLLFERSREILEKAQRLLNLISYAQKTGHYQEEVENLNPVDIINCTELATKMISFMPFVMFDEIKEEYFRLKNLEK